MINTALEVDHDRDGDREAAEALVREYQAGDTHAFDELYRKSWARVFRICIQSVRNHHVAEELTQETMARAWRALPRFAGDQQWHAWLRVIAKRVCIDAHRRRLETESLDVHAPTIATDDDVETAITGDASRTWRAVSELPAAQRDVFQLLDIEGWTRRRAARHLNLTPGRVESLLLQARRQLRATLRD